MNGVGALRVAMAKPLHVRQGRRAGTVVRDQLPAGVGAKGGFTGGWRAWGGTHPRQNGRLRQSGLTLELTLSLPCEQMRTRAENPVLKVVTKSYNSVLHWSSSEYVDVGRPGASPALKTHNF